MSDGRTGSLAGIEQQCINTIRTLSMDAIQKANSGHPGAPMGLAPAAFVLWTRILKHNPANPDWLDRDRFVLSGGHASMLLYSILYLTGYDLSLDDIKNFRQWGSRTPGHPEFGHTPGSKIQPPVASDPQRRFDSEGHPPGPMNWPDPDINPEYPYTLDFRLSPQEVKK